MARTSFALSFVCLLLFIGPSSLAQTASSTTVPSNQAPRTGPDPDEVLKAVDQEIYRALHPRRIINVTGDPADIPKSIFNTPETNGVGTSFWGMAENATFARAKSELAYAIFLDVQSHVDAELQGDFLRNSQGVMSGDATTNGTLFVSLLVNAIRADARAFPDNLDTYMSKNNTLVSPDANKRLLGLLLKVAFTRQGEDPLLTVAKLTAIGYEKDAKGDLVLRKDLGEAEQVLFAIGIIDEYWRYKEANKTISEQNKELDPAEVAKSVGLVLNSFGFNLDQSHFESIKGSATKLLQSIKSLAKAVKDAKQALDEKAAANIQSALTSTFSSLESLAKEVMTSDSGLEKIKKVHQLLASSFDAYRAIQDKNYALAAANLNSVAIASNDYWNWGKKKEINQFFEWANIAGSIAEAKDQTQFNSILDSISDPIGSYRTYRMAGHGRGYQSLKAYMGLSLGAERFPGETRGFGAAFVPIGLELGWSSREKDAEAGYLGVLLSPIDLGAFTATRINSTASSKPPAFRDIVAPGIYATIGISKNWPVTAGFGIQYAPFRREDPFSGIPLPSTRALVFIAVDIPYFSHLNRP